MFVTFLRWGVPLAIAIASVTYNVIQQRRRNAHTVTEEIPKCEICQRSLEDEEKKKLRCGHKFHKRCIMVVVENQHLPACPIRRCRKTFTSNVAF